MNQFLIWFAGYKSEGNPQTKTPYLKASLDRFYCLSELDCVLNRPFGRKGLWGHGVYWGMVSAATGRAASMEKGLLEDLRLSTKDSDLNGWDTTKYDSLQHVRTLMCPIWLLVLIMQHIYRWLQLWELLKELKSHEPQSWIIYHRISQDQSHWAPGYQRYNCLLALDHSLQEIAAELNHTSWLEFSSHLF